MNYQIPEENMASLEKKVKRIAKKAPIVFDVIGYDVKEAPDGSYRKIYDVEVEGEYKLPGWVFVGRIEHHSDTDNIITTVTDAKVPDRYKTCGPNCEHCNKLRSRNDTYLVYNEDTNQFKQVGKSCLKDYTGLDAKVCAEMAEFINEVKEATSFSSLGTPSKYLNPIRTKKIVIDVVKESGYDKEVTVEKINHKIDDLRYTPKSTDSDVEKYTNYANEHKGDSDYWSNVAVAWNTKETTRRHIALLASSVSSTDKAIAKAEQNKDTQFVGEVGQKIEITVKDYTLLFQRAPYTYGASPTYVYKIVGTDGNAYKWAASYDNANKMKKGAKIKATIKSHDEYRGEKQTVITRGKITESIDYNNDDMFNLNVLDNIWD